MRTANQKIQKMLNTAEATAMQWSLYVDHHKTRIRWLRGKHVFWDGVCFSIFVAIECMLVLMFLWKIITLQDVNEVGLAFVYFVATGLLFVVLSLPLVPLEVWLSSPLENPQWEKVFGFNPRSASSWKKARDRHIGMVLSQLRSSKNELVQQHAVQIVQCRTLNLPEQWWLELSHLLKQVDPSVVAQRISAQDNEKIAFNILQKDWESKNTVVEKRSDKHNERFSTRLWRMLGLGD